MRPKLFFQALLGIVSVGAIIMIMIVYFFGDNQTKVVEKVVEKEVIVYRDAPAAVTPAENYTVVQQPSAPAPVAPMEVAAAPAAGDIYTVDEFKMFLEEITKESFDYLDCRVDNSSDTIVIILSGKDDAFLTDIASIIEGNIEAFTAWDTLVQSLARTSGSAKNIANGVGLSDYHVSIAIENPANKDAVIFMAIDGETVYNFVWEMGYGNT